jgi:hypothetical protein
LHRHALAAAEDPKEQVLAADAGVPERLAFLAREPDDAAGAGAEHHDGCRLTPSAWATRLQGGPDLTASSTIVSAPGTPVP